MNKTLIYGGLIAVGVIGFILLNKKPVSVIKSTAPRISAAAMTKRTV